jgi:hypothetical protein
MIEDLYTEKGWVKTWYNHTENIVQVKWYNYTSRVHLRKSCEMQLQAMEKYGATIIIADASDAIGIPYPQDQEWFKTNLYPRSLALGLQAIICILPLNMIAKSGAKTWNDNGRKSGLMYVEVQSLEEAFSELKNVRSIYNQELKNINAIPTNVY